jgi:filamentous hemagglutinin family protein
MNAGIYKLIWSDNSKSPVVVPETAKSHGKKSAGSTKAVASILSALTIFSLPLTGFSGPNEVPQDGSVVGGNDVATITKGGVGVLNINQFEQKAIINWDTFNIGKNAVVNFIQPNARSTALNRVVGSDPSHIFGQLNANGQVILINPNGVLFGVGSSVNVGGIVATTMDIKNKDFNNSDGVWNFFTTADGVNGSVINKGDITAKKGGYIALMAPEVVNGSEGVLTANLGTVALASGDKVALNIEGRDLIAIQVEPSKLNALIENKHIIVAENGQVLMSASALSALEGAAINDVDLTPRMELENGIVRIVNSGDVTTGSMDVTAAGNAIHEIFVGGNVQTAANLSVTSQADDGVGSAFSSIALGGLTVDGELNVNSTAGDILGINNKRIHVLGNAALNAGAGSIDLNNSRNDFVTVQANATGDITLTDRNGVAVTNASAYGSLALNANVNGVDTGEVTLGDLSVGSGLSVNSNGGNIAQAELTTIQVSGDVNLDARDGVSDPARTTGDINVSNAGNLLDGSVSLYANNAALSSDSGLQINEAIIEADLTLNAGGSVTQAPSLDPQQPVLLMDMSAAAMHVGGKTSITSGGDILINNNSNNFIGEVSLQSTGEAVNENGSITSPTISIADADAILFGDVSTAGNLEIYALSGNIKQSEDTAIKAKGNTQIFADDGNVKLKNEGNDFNKLALQVINGDAAIGDKDGIAISGVINTGSLSINANADKEGRQGAVVFDSDTEVGSNLTVKSNGGNIRKADAASITVVGSTVLNAATKNGDDNGNINLANKLDGTAEVYGDVTLLGDVSLYGNKVSLLNETDLYLASSNPDKPAVEATGDVLLATTVGDIYVNGVIKADAEEDQQVTLASGVYAGTYREYINDSLVQDPDQLHDVIFADAASIEVGEEGNWRIYSDNPITAGHAPGTWVADNASKRYNVAYMAAPSLLARSFIGGGEGGSSEHNEEHEEAGNFAYYRMQPVLLVNATPHETVYGNKTKITYNRDQDITGYIFDDMYLDNVYGKLKYTLDGDVSTTGHYVAGLHNALFDYDLGLYSKLGYGFEQASPVEVRINRRELSISDVLAASRYYNGNKDATLSGGVLHGVLTEHDHHDDYDYSELTDVVGIKSMSGQFESAQPTGSFANAGNNASKRYVASMQVTLQGDDAQNYVVTTYDTRAPHQSKQGYQADDTPVINPPVPGQEPPARVSHHGDGEHGHEHGNQYSHDDHEYGKDHKHGNDRDYGKDRDGDKHSHDKDRKGDDRKGDDRKNSKDHNDDKKHGKDHDDDKKHGKDRDHDHKHKKDKHGHNHDHDHDHGNEYVPPGPIEAEIWELPAEPPVIPQYVPTPLEVLDEPRQAPVDLQSSLTVSLFDESGTTSMTGDFTSVQPLGEYNISKGTGIEIEIPASTFQHSDPNAQLEYSAQMQDGKPLPEWLKFDAATRTLKGTPPDGQTGTAVVKIIVRDTNGGEATSSLTINY